jgi:hypothetical protein
MPGVWKIKVAFAAGFGESLSSLFQLAILRDGSLAQNVTFNHAALYSASSSDGTLLQSKLSDEIL